MFAMGIRYLTGYAVATDVSNRERAEWPPHPARVFMALAAAHFETGEDAEEQASLMWLEKQGPPAMRFSESDRRDVVKHFVPVNDKAGPSKTMLQSAPNLPRDRKERFFPRVRPVDDAIYLHWAESQPSKEYADALDRLCRKVICIGHSSSLVQMWVEDNPPEANHLPDTIGSLRLRVVGDGTLGYLREQFNAKEIRAYAELTSRMAQAKGKQKSASKRELDERFPSGEPTTRRPVISLWQAYHPNDTFCQVELSASGAFDRNLMVLSIHDGPVIGLETTWQFLTGLRDTILAQCNPAPEWVSGHRPDKTPSQRPHLALLPLAFVGHPHADGHLLGVGLAFPKEVTPRDRGSVLRKLLYDHVGNPTPIDLKLGRLGCWRIVRETRESPPLALQIRTWTKRSHTWATMTPIVLDHHPRADYVKDRHGWAREVADAIAESCRKQGLPEPVGIDVGRNCWHRGVPRATPGKSGFPLMPVKSDQCSRQQVHACLWFSCDVEGPLLLGAGRYRGYGVCKPLCGDNQ
ncbi:MAG: type I-U CRISPR-associated protein Cas5/Cas6 [Phycisphaerae bacterium]|nr:type I-U CRISPR-associated protein Cas5/Cas6 [Phycisphaerae bacterium]